LAPDSATAVDASNALGREMHDFMRRLFPICRSITGNGLRRTLDLLGRDLPMVIHEIPSGTQVLDWQIPDEWNVREAYIARLSGERIVDFAENNLHLVQYSTPIDKVLPIEELRRHIHTLPETPDWIPYRTAYYARTWGFCMAHRTLEQMTDAEYRVVIDSTLAPGALSYGEIHVPGRRTDEVLISVHCCHPSLANDNLSGMTIARTLARWLLAAPRRLSYRFLFIPGTIGSIAWLARNEDRLANIRYGLVLSCLGDSGGFTYKCARDENARINQVVAHVLRHVAAPFRIEPFVPYGYDERQYCSPGFNLPVGCLMRSPNGAFPEYHTSADNLDFVRPECLAESLNVLQQIVEVLEQDEYFVNTNPKGEPQLGRRGLYRPIGGQKDGGGYDQLALLWALNLSDGTHSLLDIARRAEQPFHAVKAAADALRAAGLLVPRETGREAGDAVSS